MNLHRVDRHLVDVWATEVDVEMRSFGTAASRGDQMAWDAIVREFSRLLWSIARGFRLPTDASDVVQLAWPRRVENLHQITEPDALPAWLATTVRRECLRLIRRTSRQRVIHPGEPPDRPDPGPPVDRSILLDERDGALWHLDSELSEACVRLLRVLMATPPPSYPEGSRP